MVPILASIANRPGSLSHRAGIDEAGRGCLAGPVVAACVWLPEGIDHPLLRDSKRLTPAQRELMFQWIRDQAIAIGVAEATAEEIDQINILQATLLAMRRAAEMMGPKPTGGYIVDGLHSPAGLDPVIALPKADDTVPAVSAASIIAKVTRDRMMPAADARWPGYDFSRHKGYATWQHRQAIQQLGLSPWHRRSFWHPHPSLFGDPPDA